MNMGIWGKILRNFDDVKYSTGKTVVCAKYRIFDLFDPMTD